METLKTIDIYARQGDLVIAERSSAPVALEPTTAPTVVAGSHGDPHTLPTGTLVGRQGRSFFAQPVVDTALTHRSRHTPVSLKMGQIYEIWPQIERHGDGDRDVED